MARKFDFPASIHENDKILAFSRLAGNAEFAAFLGSIRSTQLHAMAPDALKLGKPVMIGGTDPVLTHMGNQWYIRFRPNDTYSARVIADYGAKVLGKKKWAIVHSHRCLWHQRHEIPGRGAQGHEHRSGC